MSGRLAHAFLDGLFHLLRDLRRVRCAGAKNNLKTGIHVLNGAHQVNDPLLPRDAADKEEIRFPFVNTKTFERRAGVDPFILVRIDTVIDHVQARRIDIEQSLDVALRFAGNRDDRVGHFQRGFLNPQTEIVTAGELFPLPRTQRLERVDRNDKRNAVVLFGQDAAEVAVPSVAMHQIGIDVGRVEIGAATHRAENGLQRFRTSEAPARSTS